ncbi:hypothetical protein M9H77_00398 [Catharanthus roseus]|nr:hypothetical protein M9H77_00398 [Catharanthus roseus]
MHAGLLVCVLRIVTKASLPHSPNGLRISTRIYFIVSASLVFLCLIFYNFRHKLTVVKYYSSSANHVSTHHHHDHDHNQNPPIIWDVVKSIRHAAFGIVILYVVTLSIFPGYLSENVKSRFFKDWYPILLIAIFNVGDFLGKFSTAFYVPQSIYKIMWICVGRVGFYPLFAACLFGPKWLRSEAPVIILTVGLGFSNGFFTGVLMILAPKSVAPQLSERAAIAMSMFLMTGLALGSFLGWLWNI